jgi:cytochrome P450
LLQKLRQDVDKTLPFAVWDKSGKDLNHERLINFCNYENIMEGFDYATLIFRESLRIEPPVGFSTAHEFTRDVVLARGTDKELKITAGHEIFILMG